MIDRHLWRYEGKLEILRRLPIDQVIRCVVCDGKAPEPQFCGCETGTCTVEFAIKHIEGDIRILCK